MTFQAVPDGIEVVFKAVQNGIPVVNVYNVKDTSTHDVTLLTAYCDAFFTWWQTNMKPILNNSYVLNQIVATSLELSTGPQVAVSTITNNVGDLSGQAVAGNAAAVISWRTASIGRSFRGRTYIGGLDQAAMLNAQLVTSGFMGGLGDAASALLDAVAAVGGTLAVLSRYADKVLRVIGLLTEITSIFVDQKVDSQRRRTAN